jgi:hypothetical protein
MRGEERRGEEMKRWDRRGYLEQHLALRVEVGGEVASHLVAVRVLGKVDVDVAEQVVGRGEVEVPEGDLERLDDELRCDRGEMR